MSNDPPEESTDGGDGGGADEGVGVSDDEVESQVEPQVEPELDATDGDTGDSNRGGRREKGPDEQFCESCGEVIKKQAERCPHCGVRVGTGPAPAAGTASRADAGQQTASGHAGEQSGTAPDEVFCGSCGKPIKRAAEVCPHCGVRNTDTATGTKSEDAGGENGEKFCGSCGERIRRDAEVCPNCGVQHTDGTTGADSEGGGETAALVLSFFIPGGGQLYNDQTERGIAILVSYVVFWIVTILAMFAVVGFLLVFLAPLFHVGAAWDAFVQAQKRDAGDGE